jgi:hypothetical protein
MDFYELNKKMNEQSFQQVMGRPDEFLRMPAIINRIKKFGRPIGFRGPEKLSKEIEDELAKIGNIETHEEAMEKWRKIEKQDDAEKEYMRQKEEERWSQEKKAFKQDMADNKELDELEDWLDDHGHIPSDPDAWNMNNIEDVRAVIGTLERSPKGADGHKMIEKLGQHLKQLESKKALAKIFSKM